MWSIIEAAGWPIWTIITASVISLAIIFERFFSLRAAQIVPEGLLAQTVSEYRRAGASGELLHQLVNHSPLGRLFAAGLRNVNVSRDVMKEAIEDEGRVVAHQLERFLTTLGTIAAMAPLLGLLGTVIGMIEIFGSQAPGGTNPQQLAHGISIALYNTAFGLIVAIPSMMFYRHFRARVDSLLVEMESQAVKLVEVVHGERSNGHG
ncbi:MotA/TolQ/ExbB proton channel family protein [uncultured Aquitalea sp.]|uniref:MotA/TolQ/ExbB proton channel family protein n=1 Tax=uncultured Aquitalea sp. TaxID=540272 RepID=UPI0025F45E88|nr:MotA/TolQ/ExbB proton channel family protein [uncultured Aquitalea sp.]